MEPDIPQSLRLQGILIGTDQSASLLIQFLVLLQVNSNPPSTHYCILHPGGVVIVFNKQQHFLLGKLIDMQVFSQSADQSWVHLAMFMRSSWVFSVHSLVQAAV